MMDVYQQTLTLQEQHKATASLQAVVRQMKMTMRDLLTWQLNKEVVIISA
jgi:hypothetical protein